MDNIIKKLLHDVLTSINSIDLYIGEHKVFKEYEGNPMLQDAVERNLEIIGEAVNRLLKINTEITITNARRIVDVRNKIIHGYDEVENSQIWAIIIINHLPVLKQEVIQCLDK